MDNELLAHIMHMHQLEEATNDALHHIKHMVMDSEEDWPLYKDGGTSQHAPRHENSSPPEIGNSAIHKLANQPNDAINMDGYHGCDTSHGTDETMVTQYADECVLPDKTQVSQKNTSFKGHHSN